MTPRCRAALCLVDTQQVDNSNTCKAHGTDVVCVPELWYKHAAYKELRVNPPADRS